MLEMLLLMMSVGAHSAGALAAQDNDPPVITAAPAAEVAPDPVPEADAAEAASDLAQAPESAPSFSLPSFSTDTTESAQPALPSFPSLGSDETAQGEKVAVLPAFPSPSSEAAPAAPAFLAPANPAPAFLAPEASASAPPAFLSPEPQQQAASPAFLAPQTQPAQPQAAPAFPTPAPTAAPALVAEPQIATGKFTTALEVKPILAATRNSWVALRDTDGIDQLYVTHLWSWRCGLIEMRIGFNGATPTTWPMPPCHMEYQSPSAILDGDGIPMQTFPYQSIQTIEVQVIYDDLTSESATFLRKNIRIP